MTLLIDRRQLLASAAAAGLTTLAPEAFAQASGKAAQLNALYDAFFQENLKDSPETATNLGLDTGALAPLRRLSSDNSAAGIAASKALTRSQLQRLRAAGRDGLTGLDAVNYDTVLYGLQTADTANAQFDFGAPGGTAPYTLSQLSGVYQSTPTFLDTKQPLKTKDDAEAYLARLQGFAAQLDQDTDAARRETAKGVIPPDFILDKTLEQLNALASQGPDATIMVASIAKRSREAGLDPAYAAKAAQIYTAAVRPALERQIGQVRTMRAKAVHAAGIGSRPQGMDYYAAGLKAYTTSSMSAAEVHKVGLEQTKDYQSRIDVILKQQGLSQGTVGARLSALGNDKQYIWPDTDAGKAEMIKHLNSLVLAVTPRLPRFFNDPPHIPLEIRRVPPYIEAGAPLGYYNPPSLDGTRPAIYYINLQHTIDWPRWLVSSVTFHEGVPGHHLQISTSQRIPNMPLLRKTQFYSGYGEGWALYAEQLADELGMYDDDPLGRVGYLKSELWRACRMVLDSGIHTMGWTREQAIRWKMDNDGSLESGAVNEVERYCVWPGQAPSYKIGHTVLNRLRDKEKAKLGQAFDLKAFHAKVLNSGAMPLDVLERLFA